MASQGPWDLCEATDKLCGFLFLVYFRLGATEAGDPEHGERGRERPGRHLLTAARGQEKGSRGTRNYQAKPSSTENPAAPPPPTPARAERGSPMSTAPRCRPASQTVSLWGGLSPQCQRNHRGDRGAALHRKSRGPSSPAHGEVSEAPGGEGVLAAPSPGCAWGHAGAGRRPWGTGGDCQGLGTLLLPAAERTLTLRAPVMKRAHQSPLPLTRCQRKPAGTEGLESSRIL